MERFKQMVQVCSEQGVSDLYMTGGHPVVFRKDGVCHPQKSLVYSSQELDALTDRLLSPRHKRILARRWSVDYGLFISGTNLRCNIVSTSRGLSHTMHFLPGVPPSIENLNLHPTIHDICQAKSGLVLFCGATGSGKTSTIAAMINEINRARQAHIITLEDPIEYRFKSIKSFVEQREMGLHFQTFEQGLLDALRQMPDVIMVGELREKEIMRQTLNIAESGHLVFGTLHASTPEEAVYRICNAFPTDSQELIRFQLASTLQAVIVQQLLYMPKLGFRVPVLGILRNSTAVKNTLRDNKLSLLENIIELGVGDNMFSFTRYKSEFLDKKETFLPPVVSFRPSRDAVEEHFNQSSLIDYEVEDPSLYAAAPAAGGPTRAALPTPAAHTAQAAQAPRLAVPVHRQDDEADASVVRIDDDASYEDLIAQYKNP